MVRISVPFLLLFLVCSLSPIASCSKSPEALVQLDVLGDATFDKVDLRLTAAGTQKTYQGVSFSPNKVQAVGIYLPSSTSGDVKVSGLVIDGSCATGMGEVIV